MTKSPNFSWNDTINQLNLIRNKSNNQLTSENRFKVLMYCDGFVDENRLEQGLYSTNIPKLHSIDETIDNLIERVLSIRDINGFSFVNETYIENLKNCELVEIILTRK